MLGAYKPHISVSRSSNSAARMKHYRFLFSRSSWRTALLALSGMFLFSVFMDWISLEKYSHTHSGSPASPPTALTNAGHHQSSIGKLSMLYGHPSPLYERALAIHQPHNERFGYPFYVLREKTLPQYWSKPAYILRMLLAELEKPSDQRLQWLVWFDVDTVLMNPRIPLEIFLPPAAKWSHIHALVTNDHRGLNNGVFFLRVHEWSVWLMTACLGTQVFDPELELEFGDQTALMHWLDSSELFRNHTMHVPQRWFNAYAGYRGEQTALFADPDQPQNKFRDNSVREGDLLVHHAGHKSLRAQRMAPWMDVAERHSETWEVELEQTTYLKEIEEFWKKDAAKERRNVDRMKKRVAEERRKKAEKKARAEEEEEEEEIKPRRKGRTIARRDVHRFGVARP